MIYGESLKYKDYKNTCVVLSQILLSVSTSKRKKLHKEKLLKVIYDLEKLLEEN